MPFDVPAWALLGGVGAALGRLVWLYRASLKHRRREKEAEIPVERIGGPVQLISATRDGIWPSTAMCEEITRRLSDHRFAHPVEHLPIDAQHWVLAKKECRKAVTAFVTRHFPPGSPA